MAVTITYLVVYAFSLWLLLLLIKRKEYVNSVYFMLFAILTIMDAGYLIMVTARNLSPALIGFRLVRIGSVVIPLLLLFSIARMADFKVPLWLHGWLAVQTCIVLGFALTADKSNLYYSDIKIAIRDGYSVVLAEHGPLFWIYAVHLAIICFLILVVTYYAFKHWKKVSKRLVICLLIIELLTILSILIDNIIRIPFQISCLSPVLAMAVITYLLNYIELHDVEDCIAVISGNLSDTAFIIFDRKKRYVNATESAKQIFPQLRKLKADKIVPQSDSAFFTEIMDLVNSDDDEYIQKLITVRDNYFVAKKSCINSGKASMLKEGFLIELIDVTANNSYLNELNKYNKQLELEIYEKKHDISELQERLVLGMATIVESRDNTTGEHIVRTCRVIRTFVDILAFDNEGLDYDFLEKVVKAAPMHDLGKIAVDDRVLRKKGKYTEEDYNEMKKHPSEGARIVRKILAGNEERDFCEIAANIANYHHERWDGKGYPEGLKGEEIPLEARIMSLADSLDAILSVREYDWPRNYEEAFRIIEENLGTQFDPKLGETFLRNKDAFEVIYAPTGKT